MQNKILVLGGTGLLGKAVVKALKNNGFSVRLLVRDVEKAQSLLGDEFELVSGNVLEKDSLKSALDGCFGVHISVSTDAELLAVEIITSLAAESRIKRLSYISGSTVCEENRWFPMIEQKLNAEKLISQSNVDYQIFRPTWPMEMLERFARDGKPFIMGKQPAPLHFFALEDLGRMVATAFQKQDAVNKIFYVHGPEGIPIKEALQRYCQIFYPDAGPVSVMPIGLAKFMGMISGNKMLKFAARLMGYFDKVGELGDPAEANAVLGAPKITLHQWMKNRQNQKLGVE